MYYMRYLYDAYVIECSNVIKQMKRHSGGTRVESQGVGRTLM